VPKTTTIETGDAVSFANQDSIAHQIVIKPSTGFTCTAGLVLQPSQTTSCTFRVAGRYQVRDPNHTSSVFKGTISVTGPTIMVTLAASPQVVMYGGTSTLSGSLATGQTGQQVMVLGMECGLTTMKQLAVSVTTTDGAYSHPTQPARNTTYQVRFKNDSSALVAVKVKPKLTLRRVARGRYSVKVLAAESFAGKAVIFQRYVRSTGRWVTVKTVLLTTGPVVTLPLNPTQTSTRTFRARVRAHVRVRAILTQTQAGTCYLATRSNVVLS